MTTDQTRLGFIGLELVRDLEYQLSVMFLSMTRQKLFGKRNIAHIVLIRPGHPYDGDFANAVLHEGRLLGDGAAYIPKYEAIAKAKANMSWREQMDTRLIVARPTLLRPGDVKYPGGVFANNTAVGVSGLSPEDDEFFARLAAARLQALVHAAFNDYFAENTEMYTVP